MESKKKKFVFNQSLFDSQRAEYDSLLEPDVIKFRGMLAVRALFPKEIRRTSNPEKKLSLGIKLKDPNKISSYEAELATEVGAGQVASKRDLKLAEIYDEFDKKLDKVRVIPDPFEDLISSAIRQFNDPNVIHPKYNTWRWGIEFLLDKKYGDKSDLSAVFYLQMREKIPDYKPDITTKPDRGREVMRLVTPSYSPEEKGLGFDIVEEEVWTTEGGDSNWINLIEGLEHTFDSVFPTLFHDTNFSSFIPDIYEGLYQNYFAKEYLENFTRTSAICLYYFAFDGEEKALTDLYKVLDPDVDKVDLRYRLGNRPEAEFLKRIEDHYLAIEADIDPDDPRPKSIQTAEEIMANVRVQTDLKTGVRSLNTVPVINRTGCPTLLEMLPLYINPASNRNWQGKTIKGRKAEENLIKRAVSIMGNKPIDQVRAKDGYYIAQILAEGGNHLKELGFKKARSEVGLSNNSIIEYVGSIRLLLKWCITNAYIEDATVEGDTWITKNELEGLDLTSYGVEARTYEALTEEQLYALFDQEMPDHHRLILELLICTGARLDEIALLTWESYKLDAKGYRFFDLSMVQTKNDKFSKRSLALPDEAIELLEYDPYPCDTDPNPVLTGDEGKGRLFNYKLNADGKSSDLVSKELKTYFHNIRYSPEKLNRPEIHKKKPTGRLLEDDRKVVHSLRNNVTGFMLHLDPTPNSELMDWISGHGMKGSKTDSERVLSYQNGVDVEPLYRIINKIDHPYLNAEKRRAYLEKKPFSIYKSDDPRYGF